MGRRLHDFKHLLKGIVQHVAEHFLYICFLGLLASVMVGSWPCIVG